MEQKPISVKREEGYIIVDFPFPDGPKYFEGRKGIGDVVISLRKYYENHMNDIPGPLFEISSKLDCNLGREGAILESNVGDLYKFRKLE